MAWNNITSRTDVDATIPEEVVNSMIGKATESSAVLQLFDRVPVGSNQVTFPVLSALPIAYWVTGDTGLKQTTEINWADKNLTIEEIAVIMPIPQNVVDDMSFNVWDEAEPLLAEAVARVLDSAILFGTNAPASFPDDIVTAAAAAGNTNAEGNTAATGGFFGDIDEAVALLEADGYDASGYLFSRNARSKFRAARSTTGEALDRDRISPQLDMLDGAPIVYPARGLWPATLRMIAMEKEQFVLGLRKDVTIDFSTDGVIQDNTGAIIYNLFQQDMVAARVTFRAGWQVANTINNDQPTEANRYPAATLTY